MDEIKSKIRSKTESRGKRTAVLRVLRAKNDKETIAAWRTDLASILDVFNVGSVSPIWPSLTVSCKTQLTINTHVIVSDTLRGVFDIHYGVSELCRDVSDIRRDVSQIQEWSEDQIPSVGNQLVLC